MILICGRQIKFMWCSMAKYEWLYRAKFSAEDLLAKHTRISAGSASEQLYLGCM